VTGAAALSSDEREVAALVASGKTNKEIAAALYLSEKTIETPTLERQRLKHPSLLTVTRDSTAHGPTLTPNADYFRCLPGSRRIADAGRCGNGCGTGGQEVVDPGLVHIHAVGDRPGDIRLGDHADWPVSVLGAEYHQGGRPGVFHQVGGGSDVVIFPDRRR